MIAAKKPNAARNMAVTEIVNDRMRNRSSGTIGSETRDSTQHEQGAERRRPSDDQPADRRIGPLSPVCLFVRPTRNGAMARVKSAAPT